MDDMPFAMLVVPDMHFAVLDAFVSEREMDVVKLDVNGVPGFGFWSLEELNVAVEYLLDNNVDHIEFRLWRHYGAASGPPSPPPPSPSSPPESPGPRGSPDGAASTI